MGKKAGNGEGTIYKRADGRWEGAVSLSHGRRRRVYGKSHDEVKRKLVDVQKALQDGLPFTGERLTVARYLKLWLDAAKAALRSNTHTRYEQYVRLHVIPTLGRLPLSRLSALHLQRLYKERQDSGLSATSVHHLHAVVHRALSDAARWNYIPRNVADLVKPPRIARKQMTVLSPEQTRCLLETAKGDRLEALYVVALSTGMRQGELLALRWGNVGLDSATIQVEATLSRTKNGFTFQEPKTKGSRRQVELTRAAVAALRRHRAAQLQERLRCPHWQDSELVFATEVGTPIEATNLIKRSFHPLLRRAALPPMRFHDLRHTAATLLLGQGVHPKIVSEMLGHSTISTTLDLYSHVTPTMQKAAVEALDAVFGA